MSHLVGVPWGLRWAFLAVLLMALATVAAGCGPSAPAPDVRRIEIKARQFAFEPREIRVQAGTRVQLVFTSEDVTHGVALPQFGVSKVLPPGTPVPVDIAADRVGHYEIVCTVFCGIGHADHKGVLIVEPRP